MNVKNEEKEQIIQLVCFKLGAEEYAVNIIDVQEVIDMMDVLEVPQMPFFVLGIVNVRGEIIPVFDLRIKFDLAVEEFSKKARIIVLYINDGKISFVVDEIQETLRINRAQIDPAPPVKMKIKKECIVGVGEQENRMIVIVDMKEIHKDIEECIHNYNWREATRDLLG